MKKKALIIISAAVTFMGTSCQKYLNINTNPNNPTSSSPDYVLPQAIVYTAANEDGFNNYGGQIVGYMSNAGGYGGFGDSWTYDFSTTDFNGLWTSTYDVLQDIQYVIGETRDSADLAYYTAAGDILKAYNYELLVDAYNDVPYSKALLGQQDVSPAYDSAATIYVSLAKLLDSAIALINNAPSNVVAMPAGSDPMFYGNMTYWVQFANTVKLRLIVHAASAITFPNTTFDPAGFLTVDAQVNPGYTRGVGSGGATQQNPSWNDFVGTYSGGAGDRAWMANRYVTGFYNGVKLNDQIRARAIYYHWDTTSYGVAYPWGAQLGTQNSTEPSAPNYTNAWYSTYYLGGPPWATVTSITGLGNNIGVMKGPNMGQVLISAAESYFLQAEAAQRTIITGSAQTLFNSGIAASFNYLLQAPGTTTSVSYGYGFSADSAATLAKQYQAANAGSPSGLGYLANYNLATPGAEQLEAIITQKYIALNMISGQEAWNEYRRTGYPKCASSTVDPYTSFASTLSSSPRPDGLPTRILYPASEYSSNASNVPNGISPFTSLIFWAH